jgi:hypothetical protein
MSILAPRNNENPIIKEILTTASSEELDPQSLSIIMKSAEKVFLKMKEDGAKRKAGEEEARRKVEEEDKGKKNIDNNDDLVELLVFKVIRKMNYSLLWTSMSLGQKLCKTHIPTMDRLADKWIISGTMCRPSVIRRGSSAHWKPENTEGTKFGKKEL